MPSIGKPGSLKLSNRKAILNMLRNSGVLSVAELSQKAKLSKTTILKIFNYYVKEGLVLVAGKGESTDEGGKKPIMYEFNKRGGFVFACHIFPDALYSVITDLDSSILCSRNTAIKENEGLNSVIENIVQSFNSLVNEENIPKNKIIGIAIGAHGITDYNNGVIIHSPHFQSWGENVEFKNILKEKLNSDIPIFIDNQIRFQVFAEKVKGTARDKKNIIVIEGGAGLVAGIIVKDEIKRGAHNLAGEIGHMIINPNSDETCACGVKGCFESMVTTRRLLRIAGESKEKYPDSLIFKNSGRNDISIGDIFRASNQGDGLGKKIMDDAAGWYAIGLSNLVLTYDPDIIILHGIFIKAGDYFIKRLRERISNVSLVHVNMDTRIEYSKFGSEVGAVGAAAYVTSEYFK